MASLGSPHRFACLYIFLLLTIAHRGYEANLDKHHMVMGIIVSLSMLIAIWLLKTQFIELKDVRYWAINIFILLGYMLVFLIGSILKRKTVILIYVCFFCWE